MAREGVTGTSEPGRAGFFTALPFPADWISTLTATRLTPSPPFLTLTVDFFSWVESDPSDGRGEALALTERARWSFAADKAAE